MRGQFLSLSMCQDKNINFNRGKKCNLDFKNMVNKQGEDIPEAMDDLIRSAHQQ